MQKSKLKAHVFAKINVKARNQSNFNKDILKDKIVIDTNNIENFFDNFSFFNNKNF